mmetsp:Transcript_9033/g.12099  ORF Transcript_9033/g.12099 Transcript_9033/m.12099 type:complete len:232 (-) Transcript_9033:2258-2953(-)
MRVARLSILTNNAAVIKLIFNKEFGWILATVVNIDFGQSIVKRRLSISLVSTSFKPIKNEFQPVALLDFLNQLSHRAHVASRQDKSLDIILIALDIQQSSSNLGGIHWVNLLDVNLDVLHHISFVQKLGQIFNKSKSVTNSDQWTLLFLIQLIVHQEITNSSSIIAVTLINSIFHSTQISNLCSSHNIIVVDQRILREVDGLSQKVVHTITCLLNFEQIDQSLSSHLSAIF